VGPAGERAPRQRYHGRLAPAPRPVRPLSRARPLRARPLLAVLLLALALAPALAPACGEAPGGGEPAADTPESDPALASEAEFEEARNHAFRLFDAERDSNAVIDALERAHAMRPDAYGVNLRLGRAYAQRKLHDEALEHDLLARAANPEDVDDPQAVIDYLKKIKALADDGIDFWIAEVERSWTDQLDAFKRYAESPERVGRMPGGRRTGRRESRGRRGRT